MLVTVATSSLAQSKQVNNGGSPCEVNLTVLQPAPGTFRRRANVTVQWVAPCVDVANVWVGAWSPIDFPLPVKQYNLTTDEQMTNRHYDINQGRTCCNGTVTLRNLLNIRQPYQFRLVNRTGRPIAIAESALVYPSSLPMQLHTSATNVAGELQIMWVDEEDQTALGPPVVQFGQQQITTRKELISHSHSLTRNATGTSSNYTVEDFRQCLTKDSTAVQRFLPTGNLNRVVIRPEWGAGPIMYRVGRALADDSQFSEIRYHVGPLAAMSHSVHTKKSKDHSISGDMGGNQRTKVLFFADVGIGPARPEDVGGAIDSEGDAINRENAGPSAGGRYVLESVTEAMLQANASNDAYQVVIHNGDIRCVQILYDHDLPLRAPVCVCNSGFLDPTTKAMHVVKPGFMKNLRH